MWVGLHARSKAQYSLGAGETAMGADPYWYVVKYRPDIDEALQELREREFQSGRYNPVIPFLEFPIGPHSPTPGARHATMAEAFKDTGADGTRSIIDLFHISEEPEFGAATVLKDNVLQNLFGTTRPTREMVEAGYGLWDDLERGHGIYIVLYRDDQPDEIYFAGYSYD
jgi:hypothetical protein